MGWGHRSPRKKHQAVKSGEASSGELPQQPQPPIHPGVSESAGEEAITTTTTTAAAAPSSGEAEEMTAEPTGEGQPVEPVVAGNGEHTQKNEKEKNDGQSLTFIPKDSSKEITIYIPKGHKNNRVINP